MIAHIMGKENFKEVVAKFLQLRSFSAITSDELLSHLNPSVPPLVLPESSTLLSVIKSYEEHGFHEKPWTVKAQVVSGAFEISGSGFETPIQVPIFHQTPLNAVQSRPTSWISAREAVTVEKGTGDAWLIVDPGQYGMYRVTYEDSLWDQLTEVFRDPQVDINRGQLIADSTSLAIDWEIPFEKHFTLLQNLPNDTDRLTWRVVRKSFEDMTFHLRGIAESERLNKFYADVAEQEYRKHRISRNIKDFEMSMEVGWVACGSGQSDCVTDISVYVNETLAAGETISGPDDFQYLIYCTLARYSPNPDAVFRNIILGLAMQQSSFSSILVSIKGVGCARDGELIKGWVDVTVVS